MSQSRRQFTRGAATAFALHLAAMATGFVAQLLYARWMTPEDFGVFSQVHAALVIAANLLVIGVPIANLQLLPTYVQQGDWARWRGLMGWGLRRVALLSGAVAIAWCLGALVKEAPAAWGIGGLVLPTMAVIAVQQTQALGFKDVVLARLPSEVIRPALALGGFGAAMALGVHPDATLAMVAALIAGTLTLGVLAARIEQLPPDEAIGVEPIVESRDWSSTSAEFFGQGFFSMVLDRADILIVGWYLGPAAAGIYAAVAMVGKLVLFALGAVNTIGAPMFADLYAQGRHAEVQELLRLGVRVSAAIALLGCGFLALFSEPVLGLFGPDYRAGVAALWITLVGYAVNALCGSVGNLVGMAGHQRVTWRVFGAGAAAMIALDLALVPSFGIEGAAAARALSMSGWNLALAVYANRVLGLDPTIRSALRR